jgi:hypothetical protein
MFFPSGEHLSCTSYHLISGLVGSVLNLLMELAHVKPNKTVPRFPHLPSARPIIIRSLSSSPTRFTLNVEYPAASVSIWLKLLMFTFLKSHWLRCEPKMSSFWRLSLMVPSLGFQDDQLYPDASYVDRVLGAAYDIRLCEEIFNSWEDHLDRCV